MEAIRIIFICAHPDDPDIKAGGTAVLFARMGHEVKFVSVTNGDKGHHEECGGMLARRRYSETQKAACRLGIAEYEVFDNPDGELMPTIEIRHDVIRLIREWKADIVLSHRTNDYHPDHRITGKVVRDAAYMVQVPNIAPDTPPTETNPVFLYLQDHFAKPYPFQADIAVAIDEVFETKVDGLDAHVSQMYEWLPWIGNYLDDVPPGEQARREWLEQGCRERWAVSPKIRKALEKWYGPERARQVQFAETFEIAEYGHQPSGEEIRKLFPMLDR